MRTGWELKKLGEVCEIINGSTPLRTNKDYWENGTFPWFTIDDIREQGRIITKTKQKVTQAALTKLRILPINTVLICCTASVGEFALAKIELTSNQQFNGLVIKKEVELSPEFLFYFSSTLKEKLLGLSGKTTIDFIAISKLKTIEIPLPPLPEQQRIVAILDEAFAAIAKAKANAEQNLKNTKELFESYLQGVFEKKGEGWEEKPLREVCSDFLQGINTATDKTVFVDEGIPILQAKEIGLNKLDLSNTKFITRDKFELAADRYKPKGGDILYNNIGSSMGRSIIVDWDFDFAIAWNVMRIIPNRTITNPNFLNYILQSPLVYNDIISKAKGVGMPFISKKDLIEIIVSYPPLSEQQTIVRQLDALRAETQRLEAVYQQKLADLEELKKSILQKAFAGELTGASN